jgi:hypothetical protein
VRIFANHLRGRLSRALILSSASALMLGVGLPGAAQAAQAAPSSTVAFQGDSHGRECYRFDDHNDRDRDHYYRYCYDYSYRNNRDERHDKRWYDSYELYYWYFTRDGHKRFDSCSFDHDFGYDHPDRPWRDSCHSR